MYKFKFVWVHIGIEITYRFNCFKFILSHSCVLCNHVKLNSDINIVVCRNIKGIKLHINETHLSYFIEDAKPVVVTPSLPAKELPKKTTPPSSPKPTTRGPKPQVTKDKPATRLKPTPAPKSNKVASLMKSFQQPQGEGEGGVAPPTTKGTIELDRSPMTGRKMDRKQSVKELTQRYSQSDEDEMSPKHDTTKGGIPSKPPRPAEVPPPTPPGNNNPAMNMFKRKQLEIDTEGPPPSLPSKPSLNKAPPPTPPTEVPSNEGPPRSPRVMPKRDVPRPQEPPSMTGRLSNFVGETYL